MTCCLYLWIGERDDTLNSICAFQMDQSVDFELKRSNRCSNSGWPNPSMPSKWEWWLYNATNKNCNDWKWTSRCDEAYTKWHFQPFAGSDERFREIISKFSKKIHQNCSIWIQNAIQMTKYQWIGENLSNCFELSLPEFEIHVQQIANVIIDVRFLDFSSQFKLNLHRIHYSIAIVVDSQNALEQQFQFVVPWLLNWLDDGSLTLSSFSMNNISVLWNFNEWQFIDIKLNNELHTVCKSYENSNSSK